MGALISEAYEIGWVVTNGAGENRRMLEATLVTNYDKTMEMYGRLNEDQQRRFRNAIDLDTDSPQNITIEEIRGALALF